jgi:hypothetical protein
MACRRAATHQGVVAHPLRHPRGAVGPSANHDRLSQGRGDRRRTLLARKRSPRLWRSRAQTVDADGAGTGRTVSDRCRTSENRLRATLPSPAGRAIACRPLVSSPIEIGVWRFRSPLSSGRNPRIRGFGWGRSRVVVEALLHSSTPAPPLTKSGAEAGNRDADGQAFACIRPD